MGSHLIDGEFQSDKYPTCPRSKVPLSVKDPTAQDLLWSYAQRRRAVDAEFLDDLETALVAAGYLPIASDVGIATLDRGDGPEPVSRSFVSPEYAARITVAADEERVRSVVERAAAAILGPNGPRCNDWVASAHAIADRVAKQLASAAVRLTPEDVETIRHIRLELIDAGCRFIPAVPFLDRLLATVHP